MCTHTLYIHTQELPLLYRKTAERRPWTELEDRFLICAVASLGYGKWEDIRRMAKEAWCFRMDWFMLSRTAMVMLIVCVCVKIRIYVNVRV
jgi:hypothetical protein